jgi:hypothetical protein
LKGLDFHPAIANKFWVSSHTLPHITRCFGFSCKAFYTEQRRPNVSGLPLGPYSRATARPL